jgi:leucyl aminopeptidase
MRWRAEILRKLSNLVKPTTALKLPDAADIKLRSINHPPARSDVVALDALLVVVPAGAAAIAALRRLPDAALWQALHAREAAAPQTCRTGALGNPRQTLLVLGYARANASAFERLQLAGRMLHAVAERRPARVGCFVPGTANHANDWHTALVSAAHAHSFAMPDYRSKPPPAWQLRELRLFAAPALPLARLTAVATATNRVRWLTALPPNVLTAGSYRRLLQQLARVHGLSFTWHDEAALKRAGAGAFLAVARGNGARTAGIAHLVYRGRRKAGASDAALVGKGILFDTGGTNLKPHKSMLDMHTDMSGSAVALATLLALAELRAPLQVEAWLAITENNIGPNSYRPQEVVQAANGTTIQVIHTDAEGRMVLADTLALAARARPKLIMDFATLTGACVYALTDRYSGVFSNRPALLERLQASGVASGERVWPFPFDADFDTDLDSRLADIKQCAVEGAGDHILAARFLKRFVPDAIPWVHVDLAAATRRDGLAHVPTEITGFGARFALQWLLR